MIGQALLGNVLDEAAENAHKKDYNELMTVMQKGNTSDKKMRNKFTIDYIMSKLSFLKLKLIRHRFKQKLKSQNDGLTILEFVELMKMVVPNKHSE